MAAIFKTTFSCVFTQNLLISISILLKCVSKGPIKNIAALVQIMAWRRIGGKPLSEPMPMLIPFTDPYMRY